MPNIEPAECYYCKIQLADKYLKFIESVYAIADPEGILEVACADCYRKYINPIITESDLDDWANEND